MDQIIKMPAAVFVVAVAMTAVLIVVVVGLSANANYRQGRFDEQQAVQRYNPSCIVEAK